jgi:HD-GYP domain-containing protein (c-di-GMP phosphodiesterase class II)
MRLIVLNNKAKGKVLALPIFTSYGNVFMSKGSILWDKNIFRATKLGINIVYIEDDVHDFILEEVIDTRLKLELLGRLREIFVNCQRNERIGEQAVVDVVEKLIDNVSISENAYLFNNISNEDTDFKWLLHSLNVAILSIIVGYNKKYDRKRLLKLGIGALMHDVGKMFSENEDHTTIGYNLMKKNIYFSTTSYCILGSHHENDDGSGYPEGLTGDKIHEFTKIVRICNEYCNLLEYGRGLFPYEILEELSAFATSRFDEKIFKDFVASIYCYPNGLTVKLNNDKEVFVINQNRNFPSRPIVAYKENEEVKICNLMNNLTVFIKDIIFD